MQLKHILPSGTLTNGILYNIIISVTDSKGTVSEFSNAVLFYCYSNPNFMFNNIISNQVIENATYKTTLTYSQPEGEELQYYQVLLYNTNKNQIWTSGVKYDTSELSATLSSLEDNGVYYIRATGYTINGMDVDTGYIYISVNYIQPNVYALITLENIFDEGSIKIQSNIIALEAKYYGTPPPYLNNDYIDLSSANNYVYFDEGFSLSEKHFTLNIKGYGFIDNSTVLYLSDSNQTLTLSKHKGIFKSENNTRKIYYQLKVPNGTAYYYIQSNCLPATTTENTDTFSIWIRRNKDLYEVYIKNLTNG
jgi:hypothetical protein